MEKQKLTVGLFNDSFPPTIDGVASTVLNYARVIEKNHGTPVVATPWYPKVKDRYPFEVVRYPSVYINKRLGYRAGYPFDPMIISQLERKKMDIIHTHCPFISTVLARMLRHYTGAPIVFTYHTKFDVDIEKRVAFNPLRKVSVKFLLNNINACDEVWVVSQGAGENLKSLGYTGQCILMENGTDFERGRASDEAIEKLRKQHHIKPEERVFLFVGRMMWYKGVKLSIDGLRLAKASGAKFKMIFVGEGVDRPEISAYVQECGLENDCVFTGAIRDRELLRVYFSLADLFLFPSAYDTNGIVVREAAACSCPSLLLENTCAAEGIVDGDTGIIIPNSEQAMAEAIRKGCENPEYLHQIGQNAAEKIYLSWEDAVAKAYNRYQVVLERCREKNTRDRMPEQQFLRDMELFKKNYDRQIRRMRHRYRVARKKLRGTVDFIFKSIRE